jgi:prolyl 4-hydroxylase
VKMNLEQAQHHHNYTKMGFKKLKAPPDLWKLLIDFYETNKNKEILEAWPRGNTYVNHWTSPSYMLSLEDGRLRGSGNVFKRQIWNAAKPVLEEWTGKQLKESSLYGIRIYKQGAILATHLDRLPLVSSAIVNIAQDLNEPWPIEVYDHNGKAHNVTMEPGDMVLYESHTVLHGRPFPLNGSFYANVFIHFIPIDHDQMNAIDFKKLNPIGNVGGHESANHENEDLEYDIFDTEREMEATGGQTPLHIAAADGDLKSVTDILDSGKIDINVRDDNGWQPLQEAIRSENIEVVKFLISRGADIGATTRGGGTALWWARTMFSEEHPIILYLESIGAPDIEDAKK